MRRIMSDDPERLRQAPPRHAARPGSDRAEVPGEGARGPIRDGPGTGRGPPESPRRRARPGPARRRPRAARALVPTQPGRHRPGRRPGIGDGGRARRHDLAARPGHQPAASRPRRTWAGPWAPSGTPRGRPIGPGRPRSSSRGRPIGPGPRRSRRRTREFLTDLFQVYDPSEGRASCSRPAVPRSRERPLARRSRGPIPRSRPTSWRRWGRLPEPRDLRRRRAIAPAVVRGSARRRLGALHPFSASSLLPARVALPWPAATPRSRALISQALDNSSSASAARLPRPWRSSRAWPRSLGRRGDLGPPP